MAEDAEFRERALKLARQVVEAPESDKEGLLEVFYDDMALIEALCELVVQAEGQEQN